MVDPVGEARVWSVPGPRLEVVPRPAPVDDEVRGSTPTRDRASAAARRARAVPRPGVWRRVVEGFTTIVALAGLWVGAGVLRSTESGVAGRGGRAVVYVARPGDTLWAIATKLDPRDDPLQVVATLEAELHGAPLRSGVVLAVP
ncbi:MAG TPA: LysM domain-containing protein [Acidimicrobiales bacterium]|nr:LysM domain-containing protein [Acidimicrobiales bacterium]